MINHTKQHVSTARYCCRTQTFGNLADSATMHVQTPCAYGHLTPRSGSELPLIEPPLETAASSPSGGHRDDPPDDRTFSSQTPPNHYPRTQINTVPSLFQAKRATGGHEPPAVRCTRRTANPRPGLGGVHSRPSAL